MKNPEVKISKWCGVYLIIFFFPFSVSCRRHCCCCSLFRFYSSDDTLPQYYKFSVPLSLFSFFFLSLSTLNNWGHLVSSDDDNDGSNSQKSFSFIFFLSHKTFFSRSSFQLFFCSKNLFIFIIFHFGCVVVDTTQLLPQRRVSCSLMLMRNWNETPHKWMNRRKNYKFQFFSVSLFFCLLHFVGTFPAVLEIFSQRFFYVIINYYASL